MPFVYAVVSVMLFVARIGAGVCGSGEVRWAAVGFVSHLFGNVSRICLERTLASCDNKRVSRMGLEGAEMLSSREAHTGCCKIAPPKQVDTTELCGSRSGGPPPHGSVHD